MMSASSEGNQPVTLYFRCETLRDMDSGAFDDSDPYCALFDASQPGGIPRLLGRTETLKNELSPKFMKGVDAQYIFETRQNFVVKVLDDDNKGPAGDDLMGTITFQLAHVMSSKDATMKFQLDGKGVLYVTGVPKATGGSRDTIQWAFQGRNLKNMDTLGKSDPYYNLFKIQPNGTKLQLHKSAVIDNNLNPVWPRMPVMKFGDLMNASPSDVVLRFECFDEDTTGDDEMGFFMFSLDDLRQRAQSGQPFELRNGKRELFGEVLVVPGSMNVVQVPSFLDYLRSGLQINLAIAIDFTGSNGDPHQPTSLHYMDPARPNHYVRAIMSVADILMAYDTDKMVPAFGFGARMPDGNVSHCFHLNFQPNPYVQGVQGVLDCYGRTLSSVRLSGPTNFEEVIKTATTLARGAPCVYTVLLILTDGDITDMNQTISAIVNADDAPLSIVIVGVGNGCDFQMMDRLDGDREKLRNAQGRDSRRDLVQFVPFRNFEAQPPGALAADVLKEIPDQVVDYCSRLARPESIPPVRPPPFLGAAPAPSRA